MKWANKEKIDQPKKQKFFFKPSKVKKEKVASKQSRSQEPNFFKNLILTGQITRLIVIIITLVLISIFIVFGLLSLLDVFSFPFTAVDSFIFAALSGSGLYGTYEALRVRRIYKIDSIFPDFVRDLAESRRAGMTFTKAILFASKGNYGILTPEIKKISQQVSWGSSVNDALIGFSKRVNTRSIQRTISLIIEAGRSGGNVADVLDVAARDAREIKMLESERKTTMASYVVVIYVGMFVFLAIILILCISFIPAMTGEGAQGMSGALGSGLGGGTDQAEITTVFFFASIVQGFGSGLVAGVFEDGRITSSVKHVFIMVFVSWLLFKMMLGV